MAKTKESKGKELPKNYDKFEGLRTLSDPPNSDSSDVPEDKFDTQDTQETEEIKIYKGKHNYKALTCNKGTVYFDDNFQIVETEDNKIVLQQLLENGSIYLI